MKNLKTELTEETRKKIKRASELSGYSINIMLNDLVTGYLNKIEKKVRHNSDLTTYEPGYM